MKKLFFIFSVLLFGGNVLVAQPALANPPVDKNPNAPIITFVETLYDYGKIEQDGNGLHNFIYKNTGKEPLVLTNVRSSCGCTIPVWSREPLLSGKQDTIKVKYDTHRIGGFAKTVTIYSNANPIMSVVRIQGEVVAKAANKTAEPKTPLIEKK